MHRALPLVGTALICGACANLSGLATGGDDGGGGDAGANGAEAGGPSIDATPPGCDGTKEPKDAPCLVADEAGIFVSLAGLDTSPGTKFAPVRTIGHALDLGRATGKRVYLCEGSYEEALHVDIGHDNASVFGGFDCASWTYSGKRPTVTAKTTLPGLPPVVLFVENVQRGVHFTDVIFEAPDASGGSGGGASSVVALVVQSAGVTFTRVDLRAGVGGTGAPGGSPAPYAQRATDGNPSLAEVPGGEATCVCPGGATSVGGKGGIGPDGDGNPGMPALGGGLGGTGASNGGMCGTGGTGSPGAAGASGVAATKLGALTAQGWTGSLGASGISGATGHGGGGSGAKASLAGSGGGCGGCGGAGGGPAAAGGASFALVSFQSSVSFAASALVAGKAGPGGVGGAGQPGQEGGRGGGGLACSGGPGGAGGNGGSGAGGAGGISAAVLYAGSLPLVDPATTLVAGQPGAGGSPGGIAGTAALMLAAPP